MSLPRKHTPFGEVLPLVHAYRRPGILWQGLSVYRISDGRLSPSRSICFFFCCCCCCLFVEFVVPCDQKPRLGCLNNLAKVGIEGPDWNGRTFVTRLKGIWARGAREKAECAGMCLGFEEGKAIRREWRRCGGDGRRVSDKLRTASSNADIHPAGCGHESLWHFPIAIPARGKNQRL